MRRRLLAAIAVLTATALVAEPALAQKKPPYWASIAASKARMRTGPGKQYPATWLYQRAGLPLKVIDTFPNWRKVEDPDGERGWIQANLLSEDRTAIVTRGIRPLRAAPDVSAAISWRVEPGVVGKLSDCDRRWCRFEIGARGGFVEITHIWGADAAE